MTKTREAFEGGVAVITGSGSGIGEGTARHAASLGMKVVVSDVAEDRIARVAADINKDGGKAIAVPADVRDAKALDRLADAAEKAFGDVRLLINNAGIETLGYSWELSAEAWEKIIGININGVVQGVRAFAPRMIAANKPAYIANVSSVGGVGQMPAQGAYVMSKHAVLSFSECLSLEMQAVGAPIHVAAILPGPVKTRVFIDSQVGGDRDFVEGQRAFMENMIADGLTGLQAGEVILNGLAANDFWITTHPEMLGYLVKERAAYLTAMKGPVLPDGTKKALRGEKGA